VISELDRIKQSAIQEAKDILPDAVFIETGTASGVTSEYAASIFRQVYSIDLNVEFYQEAFFGKFFNHDNLHAIYGDSATVLGRLLSNMESPCVILLDAHYVGDGVKSPIGDTPIKNEIETIASSNFRHVILVDDMRLFGVDESYPDSDFLVDFAVKKNYKIITKDDIARLVPYELCNED